MLLNTHTTKQLFPSLNGSVGWTIILCTKKVVESIPPQGAGLVVDLILGQEATSGVSLSHRFSSLSLPSPSKIKSINIALGEY